MKVRFNLPDKYHGVLRQYTEKYNVDSESGDLYRVSLADGVESYLVYKKWCVEVPDFKIELPEDLFD